MTELHPWLKAIEQTIALEAAHHAEAALMIHEDCEAEFLSIDAARAVYAGNYSPINGVHGITDENSLESLTDFESFFASKDCSLRLWLPDYLTEKAEKVLGKKYKERSRKNVFGAVLSAATAEGSAPAESAGDNWTLLYTQSRKLDAKEPDWWSAVKEQQKNTRRMESLGKANYTYYGIVAWSPDFVSEEILSAQLAEAQKFQCPFFASFIESPRLNLIYERILYERT